VPEHPLDVLDGLALLQEQRAASAAVVGTALSPGEILIVPLEEFTPKPDASVRAGVVKVLTDGQAATATRKHP
jgi:hypothetical protein